MNHDNSSPAVTEQQLPKDDGGPPHQESSDVAANSSALMEKWGCTLDELYRIAVKFFKGKYVFPFFCASFHHIEKLFGPIGQTVLHACVTFNTCLLQNHGR